MQAKSYLELIEHLERESKHDDSKETEALLYLGNHCKVTAPPAPHRWLGVRKSLSFCPVWKHTSEELP
jgi:hypothetical protein